MKPAKALNKWLMRVDNKMPFYTNFFFRGSSWKFLVESLVGPILLLSSEQRKIEWKKQLDKKAREALVSLSTTIENKLLFFFFLFLGLLLLF